MLRSDFFGVSPAKLRTEQAAVLVGMLKANTYYNPARHPENALARRNVVLTQMVKYNYLKQAVCDSLKQLPIKVEYYKEGHNEGLATYFREHLRLELEEILKDFTKSDGTPYNLYTDGLKIYTTVNSRMQRYAEEAVEEHMAKLQQDLYDNWKKRTAPWQDENLLKSMMKQSPRYETLKKQGYSEAEIEEIFTTPVAMRIFTWEEGEVEKEWSPLDSIRHYLSILNTGFLVTEPESGMVRAWVGGIDHQYFQYDHVKSRRQVGSIFKPIVYAAALESGMLPCEYTANEQVTYTEFNNWRPRNADNEYGGVYSMEGALSQSVNSVAVEIILRAGVGETKDLAKKMGIDGYVPKEPSIALGTPDASLYEMIQVYSTIANRGRRPSLHYLDRIETADGKVLVKFRRPNTGSFPQVMSPDHADMLIKMMQAVVDSGTGRRLRYEFGLGNDIAGKTGTTQNNSDGWFIGFTPKLVAGAWVGAETPQVHFRSTRLGQGGYSALPIWGRFMRKVNSDGALKDWRWGKFTPPVDSVMALMQCPHFLPEMPMFVDDLGLPDSTNFFQRLFKNLKKDDEGFQQEASLQMPERLPDETDAQYAQRVKAWRAVEEQKDGQREQRKNFWSKVLFGKEKKENEEKNNRERNN
ncbi:MAG: transglycosylase domain-containing protein [Saprospiraceae bacterium]|nr:transglycosylase domain-containing protein [Saprospiraceae bacterium]